MPKGDRAKLKADPDDGWTPISNLLLEILAMARLSGLQIRAILYLLRRTSGWCIRGKRLKERAIPLSEWSSALNIGKSRASAILSDLVAKNIILRKQIGNWQGYLYSLNTNISQWNSNSIDLERLSKAITVAHNRTVPEEETVAEKDHDTVTQTGTEQLPEMVTQPDTISDAPKEKVKKGKKGGRRMTSPPDPRIKELLRVLQDKRGYSSAQYAAEAKAIKGMLGQGYSPDEILSTYDRMNSNDYWADKELSMMSVHKQIGKLTRGKSIRTEGDNEWNMR